MKRDNANYILAVQLIGLKIISEEQVSIILYVITLISLFFYKLQIFLFDKKQDLF